MGELYDSTTNPIIQSDNTKRNARRDRNNYMKLKPKSSDLCLFKIHGLFEDNTGNS
jgi:hypothetical protein